MRVEAFVAVKIQVVFSEDGGSKVQKTLVYNHITTASQL